MTAGTRPLELDGVRKAHDAVPTTEPHREQAAPIGRSSLSAAPPARGGHLCGR